MGAVMEDLLNGELIDEPIKDEEVVYEKEPIILGATRSNIETNSASEAKYLRFATNNYGASTIADVSNLKIGTVYRFIYSGKYSQEYTRGTEVINSAERFGNIWNFYITFDGSTTSGVIDIISEPVEPTPEPTPEPEYPTVSENVDYRPAMNQIIRNQERIISQNELLKDVIVSIGDDINNNNSSETISINSVSRNILYTPLEEYTLTEQIFVVELVIGLVIGLVILIKKVVPRWK